MDIDDDGNVDNPEIFDQIVDPDNQSVPTSRKTIFQKNQRSICAKNISYFLKINSLNGKKI